MNSLIFKTSRANVNRAFMLMVCLVAAASAQRATAAEQAQGTKLDDYLRRLGYAPIRFEVNRRNRPLITAELGSGKKPVWLLDTGWWDVVGLDKGSAAGLKTLGELGVVLEDRLMGPLTNKDIVVIDKLRLGQCQFFNQPARVENFDLDFTRSSWHGTLGADFLLRNFCLIDCGCQRLYVRATGSSQEQSRALSESLRRSGYCEVDLGSQPGLVVQAKIHGQPVELVVDTGFGFSVLNENQLKPLGLSTVKKTRPRTGSLILEEESGRVVGPGKIGVHLFHVTTVKSLQIGPKEIKDVHLQVLNLKAWGPLNPDDADHEPAGLLGMDILAGRGALIDVCSRKLWFSP